MGCSTSKATYEAMGIHVHVPTANEQLALSLLEEMHKSKDSVSMPVLSHADRVPGGQRGVSDEFLRAVKTFYQKHGGTEKTMDVLCDWDPSDHLGTSICSLTRSTGLSLAETIVFMGKKKNMDVSGLIGPATTHLCYSSIGTKLEDLLAAVNAVKIERKPGDGEGGRADLRNL